MQNALVAALVSCADSPHRSQARRFVEGLSADELQFIAGFLGACLLDSSGKACATRAQWAERIARYQLSAGSRACRAADREHKMILLLEYLGLAGRSPEIPAGRFLRDVRSQNAEQRGA